MLQIHECDAPLSTVTTADVQDVGRRGDQHLAGTFVGDLDYHIAPVVTAPAGNPKAGQFKGPWMLATLSGDNQSGIVQGLVTVAPFQQAELSQEKVRQGWLLC